MIDMPTKGEVLAIEVPTFELMQLYKLYHKFELVTELSFSNHRAIDLFSGDGQIQETEEYEHINKWLNNNEYFSINIKEFRLERMYPIPEMRNAYLWNSRIPDVKFDKSKNKELLSGGWSSLFWHADTYQPENRIKMIIYLNDVNESNGAVCMEEDLTYINDESYSEIKNKYSCVSDIPGKFFNGNSGTAVIFRARQLHRINFPIEKHRDTIHIGFDSE